MAISKPKQSMGSGRVGSLQTAMTQAGINYPRALNPPPGRPRAAKRRKPRGAMPNSNKAGRY